MKLAAIVLVMLVACSKKKEEPKASPAPAASSGSAAPGSAATPAMTSPADEAFQAYEAKQWAKCVELYAKIDRADARYNAACCLALDGQKDDAFKMLDRVLADGFRDVDHLEKDTDLASLHDDPRWAKLVAAARANVTKFEAGIKDPALRKELLALREEDQAARQAIIKDMDNQAVKDRVAAIDTKATARMKEIVAKHGWPGKSLVGEDGASTAWLLVQHADMDKAFQKQCLPLLEQAYKAGEASERDYAYLYDRVAVGEGKPQRYGTQFKDGKPQPIEDEANVDARRKAIGLGTMAEYAKDMERMYGKK
ncbi:MAG: hypothetical protein M4D80_03610 [Myxococcota bacterium]|nr:hypothetical protein [Myxococcota bacterium]